jgi:hypothetical protein
MRKYLITFAVVVASLFAMPATSEACCLLGKLARGVGAVVSAPVRLHRNHRAKRQARHQSKACVVTSK